MNAFAPIRVLGIDPGLGTTGYGIIDSSGGQSKFVECGLISTDTGQPLAERLWHIQENLQKIIAQWHPQEASIEQIFYHRNARSALLLGHSRGVACAAVAAAGLMVFEYTPRLVKLSVTGYGNADKDQVADMVKRILSLGEAPAEDAADALANAICHSHRRQNTRSAANL